MPPDAASRPVAITGLGLTTALGSGVAANWRGLIAGSSGVRNITRFPTTGLRTTVAACIPSQGLDHGQDMACRLAEEVTGEALAQSGLRTPGRIPARLVLAVPPWELELPFVERSFRRARAEAPTQSTLANLLVAASKTPEFFRYGQAAEIGVRLARRFGFTGVPLSVNTACASGASGIQLAVAAVRRGAPVVVVVGADASVNPEVLVRFSLLGALSSANTPPAKACKPFSKNRGGFVMGEGAGALVLENPEHARARGARALGYVLGHGDAVDTFHRTRSHPSGDPIARSVRQALGDACLPPDAVDYINAHGTGTPENDRMESLGIRLVFGEGAASVPVSASKSMIGHTLSAAGAVEAVISVLTLLHGELPPTINYDIPDPSIPLDVVPNRARKCDVGIALSNSFGFGGQNVSLVFGRDPGNSPCL